MDLRVCYAGRGWKTLYRQVIEENRSAVEMDLYKESTNEHAYSLAGSIVTSGEWIPWPKASFSERVAERFAGVRTATQSGMKKRTSAHHKQVIHTMLPAVSAGSAALRGPSASTATVAGAS